MTPEQIKQQYEKEAHETYPTYTDDEIDAIPFELDRHQMVRANTEARTQQEAHVKARLRSSEELTKLQAFKDYVHQRLDDAGIEKDPESEHKVVGCRIGGRLDIVLDENAKLQGDLKEAREEIEKWRNEALALRKENDQQRRDFINALPEGDD